MDERQRFTPPTESGQMAAEFDTQPNYRDEDDPPPPSDPPARRADRGIWGTLALLVLVAVVALILLAQCTAQVPDTVGLDRPEAGTELQNAGLAVGDVSEIPVGSSRPGTVSEQAPAAGTWVRKGTTVDLMVTADGNLKVVPDVVGHDVAGASIMLQQAGFEPADAEEYSDTVPVDACVSQSPPGGALAAPGSTVTVYYSLGPQALADSRVLHTDTSDGLTDATRDSTGDNSEPLVMNCVSAYPGATAWSSGGDIYVRLAPGQAPRRATSTADWDTDPVISPSHKYLVFSRAPAQGQRPSGVGAVCFTSFATHMLSMVPVSLAVNQDFWYGRPVFAPSEGSTSPNTDWIVFAQYFRERYSGAPEQQSARLIVCNVPMDSKWVAWNLNFRPVHDLTLSRSSRAGCVHVRHTDGAKVLYDREFQLSTGLFLR
jgi:hypothetical protein